MIADYFNNHTLIKRLEYPFLGNNHSRHVAKKQMSYGGSMVTIELRLSKEKTFQFCKNLMFFKLAESLGGVESLVCHPATMSHASLDKKVKDEIGITDSLIRLSVGCEDFDDLLSDLLSALENF